MNRFDAIVDIPEDRWNVKKFFEPAPARPGRTHVTRGGFIEGVDRFDAGFFGISPKEAACIDPQQRLLLEVAWEALEDGGQVPEQLAGTDTSVCIATVSYDYEAMSRSPLSRH